MTTIERQASSIDTVTRPGAGDILLLRAEGLALARADALIIEDLDLELHKGMHFCMDCYYLQFVCLNPPMRGKYLNQLN